MNDKVKVPVATRIDPELRDQLGQLLRRNGTNTCEFLRELIKAAVEEEKRG